MQEHNSIESRLLDLKQLELQIEELAKQKDELRKEILGDLENNGLKQFKTDFATVSYVERKTIKINDENELIENLKKLQIVKYIDLVPEVIIPEHHALNKNFEKDVKDGKFSADGVVVEVKELPMIKFK